MADYNIVVDDSDSQIVYGPNTDSWGLIVDETANTFQSTSHYTQSANAKMSFSYMGGGELIVRGNFVGNNSVSASTTYPIFQADLQTFLPCSPGTPQNDGQFFCTATLAPKIDNHTLTMFLNPDAAIQPFQIDYIRYASSSQVAEAINGAMFFAKGPDNHTPALSFQGNWGNVSLGSPQTVTTSSKATYSFVGSTFAWFNCCMSSGTSGNAANVSYSFDGGASASVQVDDKFIEGPHCQVQRILFQSQSEQLDAGNHTVEVVYNGDQTKMPLSLCSFAASPMDFTVLDPRPESHIDQPSTSPTSVSPTSTLLEPSSTSSSSSGAQQSGQAPSRTLPSGVVAGIIICGVVIVLLSLFIAGIWWRKRLAIEKARSKLFSDELLPRAYPIDSMATESGQSTVIISPITLASQKSSKLSPISTVSSGSLPRSGANPFTPSELASRPPSYHIQAGSSTAGS